jgi:hypothetical protein
MPEGGEATVTGEDSKAQGERRLFRRFHVALKARLKIGEHEVPCTILDLSLGGAGLAPALPELVGQSVRLLWEELGLPAGLRATVLNAAGERTHLAFDLDEDGETALTMFLLTAAVTLG